MAEPDQIYNLEDQRRRVKADTENGFDKLASALTDALANPNVKLSAREYQVILAVISKTYRYHKKSDWITSTQLAEITGISRSHMSEIRTSLIEKNVLIPDGKKLGINTTVSDWGSPKNGNIITQKRVKNNYPKTGNPLPKNGEPLPKNGNIITQKREPHKKTTIQKTTIQKTIESLPLPDFFPRENWLEFLEHRKQINKKFTELAATKFLAKLTREHEQGFDVIALIDDAIANGWQTTYPKQNFKTQSPNRAKPENFQAKNYGSSTFTGEGF